jgi:hypothetical protein
MTTVDNLGSDTARDCVCLLLVLCASLSCAALAVERSGEVNGHEGQATHNSSKSDATVFYLSSAKRSIAQPVEPNEVSGARFVQVEVTEVVNRKKIPLSFEVRYQAKDDTRIYLGSFALYPADNPGKFIVATQGKVKGDGAIVLTLVISEKVYAEDVVKVGIRKIRLVRA